jgi:GNAT superfamily N-acetyltransferase/RimJ/RimL family protein N-acetyltransferase
MKTIHLRPTDPKRDFSQIAVLISSQEDETTTEDALNADYEKNKENAIGIVTAEDEQGDLMGFYWAYREKVIPDRVTFTLVVKPERQGQGAGHRLYGDMEKVARQAQIKALRVSVRDTCPECRAFAERRGFNEQRHHFGMSLDLETFDDRAFDKVIAKLKGEGFQFTSMEELGNTEEAQKKLYILNDTAAASTPGTNGEHAWKSFEDFQKSVCQTEWYKPAGQLVVIDTTTGAWAAMSAITRLKGNDYAYNLFTGVDMPYRGRKLGQVVKVLAIRYAREVLKVKEVHTHHNTQNLPMIAIDQKLGYTVLPGTFLMEKDLSDGILDNSIPKSH